MSFDIQFLAYEVREHVVALHGLFVPVFPLLVEPLPLQHVQFVGTFAEELAEGFAHGQRVEVAVELAVAAQLEAGDEQQELRQLDAGVLRGKERGELRQG